MGAVETTAEKWLRYAQDAGRGNLFLPIEDVIEVARLAQVAERAGLVPPTRRQGGKGQTRPMQYKYSDEEIADMRRIYAETNSRALVKEKYAVSDGYLSQVLNLQVRVPAVAHE